MYIGREVQLVTGEKIRFIEETVNLNPWTIKGSNKLKNALILEETVFICAGVVLRTEY